MRDKARSSATPEEPVRVVQAEGAKSGFVLEHLLKVQPTGFAYRVVGLGEKERHRGWRRQSDIASGHQ